MENERISEREQTDESLRVEREKADQALGEELTAIDETADAVISRARSRADEVLAAARAKTDRQLATQVAPSLPEIVMRERAQEDQAFTKNGPLRTRPFARNVPTMSPFSPRTRRHRHGPGK